MQIFRFLTAHVKFQETMIGVFFQLKKCRGFVSWRWGVMQKLEKNWFIVSKMTRIWWILTWALNSIKNCTWIGLFCAKYITFGLKKYRGALHGTEEWCEIWKKTWIMVSKMTWEIWQTFTRAYKSLNIEDLMGSFYPK